MRALCAKLVFDIFASENILQKGSLNQLGLPDMRTINDCCFKPSLSYHKFAGNRLVIE